MSTTQEHKHTPLSCNGDCQHCTLEDIECSDCGRLMCPSDVRYASTDTEREFPICPSCDNERDLDNEDNEIYYDGEESDLP